MQCYVFWLYVGNNFMFEFVWHEHKCIFALSIEAVYLNRHNVLEKLSGSESISEEQG